MNEPKCRHSCYEAPHPDLTQTTLKVKLVREGVSLKMMSAAAHKIDERSLLRRAFLRACLNDGLDADSPCAEAVCKLIESYGWEWSLREHIRD